jgi:hypothetical protein
MQINLDRTTLMMVEALANEMGKEPVTPDNDYHTPHQLDEVARHHNEWAAKCAAWRLLIGARMVQLALEAHAHSAKIAATPVLRDGG